MDSNEYVMTDEDLPKKYQQIRKKASPEIFEQEMRKMVKMFPAMFAGEKWDKYRDKQENKTEEQENDEYNKPIE